MADRSELSFAVRRAAVLALAAGTALTLAACASTPPKATADGGAPPRELAGPDGAPLTQDELAAAIAEDVDALEEWFNQGAQQASMQRDAERLGSEPPRVPPMKPEPIIDDSVAVLPANAGVDLDDEQPVEMELTIALPDELRTPPAPPAPAEPEPTREQRIERLATELAARLREQAESGEQPLQALAAIAALELIQPGIYESPAAAELLTSGERDTLNLWRDMLRYTGRSLAENDSSGSLLRSIRVANEQARDLSTLELTKVALCARVDGFGQYEELESAKMLAGRPHRIGLYVEVDGFGARPGSNANGVPAFGVELTRELSLYHDADGLLAWRRPGVDITDSSLNRRRDFFFSEVIELPQTLTVGSYRLKVAVTDRVTGAVAESIIPIDIVADARLTRGDER
jgi:hypothetical protein